MSRSSVAVGFGGMSLGIHRVPYEQQMCLDKSQLVHKSIKANSEHQALISQIVFFSSEEIALTFDAFSRPYELGIFYMLGGWLNLRLIFKVAF